MWWTGQPKFWPKNPDRQDGPWRMLLDALPHRPDKSTMGMVRAVYTYDDSRHPCSSDSRSVPILSLTTVSFEAEANRAETPSGTTVSGRANGQVRKRAQAVNS